MFGSTWSIFFDDMVAEKIKIFDQGVDNRKNIETSSDKVLTYGVGKIITPNLKPSQPLFKECKSFIESINNDYPYRNDGLQGYWTVKICELVEQSIISNKKQCSYF